LGTVVSELLVRCGIGNLIIVDNGIIDEPDLNRQIFYSYKDLGRYKVDVAKERLLHIFPEEISPQIFSFKDKITNNFLKQIFSEYKIDVVTDCLDNFETRFLLDDISKTYNVPFLHAGVNSFFGQILNSKKSLKEIYKNLNSDVSHPLNIFPPVNFVVGGLLVSEVIKIITNTGFCIFEKIFSIDLFYNEFVKIDLS